MGEETSDLRQKYEHLLQKVQEEGQRLSQLNDEIEKAKKIKSTMTLT
jgi:heterodisulfide reductase subunit C